VGRVRDTQRNVWGEQEGLEPQRADLWLVNLDQVASTFYQTGFYKGFSGKTSYYASSVSMPEKRVGTVVMRRDSRPYNMPSFDEPLSPTTVVFRHEINPKKILGDVESSSPYSSEIYKLLNFWLNLVRAGRGAMSVEDDFTLSTNFSTVTNRGISPLHSHNIRIALLKGNQARASGVLPSGKRIDTDMLAETEEHFDFFTTLEESSVFILHKAWIFSLKVSDLSHEQSGLSSITAQFYADDIQPLRI
jgi:hypothetical protein